MPRPPDPLSMRITINRLVNTGEATRLRKSLRMSLPEAAATCGCSADSIRLWESGKRCPEGTNLGAYYRLLSRMQDAAREGQS